MVLEEAGYVSIRKDTSNRRPLTVCHLTPLGRERFVTYLGELELALREGAQAATGSFTLRLRAI